MAGGRRTFPGIGVRLLLLRVIFFVPRSFVAKQKPHRESGCHAKKTKKPHAKGAKTHAKRAKTHAKWAETR